MKDYYKILGVSADATPEEIRQRYVELVKLYHPDMKKTDHGSDKINEVNEAYEVLKDESARMDYDLRRSLRKSNLKGRDKDKTRVWLKRKTVLFVSILFVIILFSLLLWKRPAGDREKSPETYHPIITHASKKFKPEARPKDENSKPTPLVSQGKPSLSHPPPLPVPIRKPETPVSQVRPQEVVLESPPVTRKEESKSLPVDSPETAETSEKPAIIKHQAQVGKPSSVPEERPKPDPIVVKESEEKVIQEPKKEVPPAPSSKLDLSEIPKIEPAIEMNPPVLAEGEVRQFLADYVDRYVRKDIEGFLELFSPKAIQNGKDGLERIRAIYTKFFNQSEGLDYHLEDVKISIEGSDAKVTGRYLVTQRLKPRGTEKLWRGNLRWTLVKKRWGS